MRGGSGGDGEIKGEKERKREEKEREWREREGGREGERDIILTGSVGHLRRLKFQVLNIDGPLRRMFDHLIRSAREDPIADLVAVVPVSGVAKFGVGADLVEDLNERLGGLAGALRRFLGLQQV